MTDTAVRGQMTLQGRSCLGAGALVEVVRELPLLRAFASSREASQKPPVREISHEDSMMAGR